jgi:hypothetical protein
MARIHLHNYISVAMSATGCHQNYPTAAFFQLFFSSFELIKLNYFNQLHCGHLIAFDRVIDRVNKSM